MTFIMDIETNGLLDTLTKIHCASVLNTETNAIDIFIPDDFNLFKCKLDLSNYNVHMVKDLINFLETLPSLSCHNGIGFDLKVLKKLYNYEYKGDYKDTLLMSRILWPDIEAPSYTKDSGIKVKVKGPHSVEAWGVRLSIKKPKHEDWVNFSEDMLHRNIEDTKIQALIYKEIMDHIDTLTSHDKRLDFKQVFKLEHSIWEKIEKQADYGWLFDIKYAYQLSSELEDIIKKVDSKLLPLLPIRVKQPYDTVCKAYKIDGTLTINAKNWVTEKDQKNICGDFSRVTFEKMNLGADAQVKEYLLENGWEPTEWNVKKDRHNKPIRDYENGGKHIRTSPKLPSTAEDWDNVGKLIDMPAIKLIAERSKAAHRLSMLKGKNKNTGWINVIRPDQRIPAKANTCSTNTTRFAHSGIVNVPKSEEGVYYGKQMRSLFIVPENKLLVGIDASALEARCEAHYIYPFDKDGAMELIEGDIHSKNALIFDSTRGKAKGAKYCLVYGGSAPKLASVLGKPKSMAQELYDAYWSGNPGVKKLKQLIEAAYKKWGYILSIDKRPLTIRYKHALINTLFQSCGSIIMKIALINFEESLNERKIIAPALGNFHDEWQREAEPEQAEEVGLLGVKAIEDTARQLLLNVPFTGEYKVGKNWAETH